ncbi:MAG TPA: transposon-transfer assisting family protein [Clostridia bacterium]|nr:transposon-transfer assisting family protein [Clostridia bacterium]
MNTDFLFTVEEMNLMCIFPTTTKSILMQSILDAQPWMLDVELTALARNTLFKLTPLTDAQFQSIQFIPVYDTDIEGE